MGQGMGRFGYFLLGAAAASVFWLVVLAFLDNELLHTFLRFGGS